MTLLLWTENVIDTVKGVRLKSELYWKGGRKIHVGKDMEISSTRHLSS